NSSFCCKFEYACCISSSTCRTSSSYVIFVSERSARCCITWPAMSPLSQIGKLPWTIANQPFEISCQLEFVGELTHSPPPVVGILGSHWAAARMSFHLSLPRAGFHRAAVGSTDRASLPE